MLIEFSEESGSPDLPHYMDLCSEIIGAPNLVICLDSGAGDYKRFWTTTSLRGLIGLKMKVEVLKEGVHSGGASGHVPSSFRIARSLLSRLEDEKTGEILIDELNTEIPNYRIQETKNLVSILNNDQIGILSAAGDDENLMNIPSGSLSNYDENRILYKKEIVEGVEIYVYSNNPEDELYTVRFQNVGENQGNYILSSNNAIENIYEYIMPIDSQRQGNFEPIIKIISPKKRQIAVLNSNLSLIHISEPTRPY